MELVKKHVEKIKFGIVGVANTAVDFIILFILVNLGLDKIHANYISTGLAFIFSFFVNKSFTFKSTSGNAKKQFVLFLLVTMTGLWVIQPIIIALVTTGLETLIDSSNIVLLVAKLIASIASLTWNYLFYSRLIFKKASEE